MIPRVSTKQEQYTQSLDFMTYFQIMSLSQYIKNGQVCMQWSSGESFRYIITQWSLYCSWGFNRRPSCPVFHSWPHPAHPTLFSLGNYLHWLPYSTLDSISAWYLLPIHDSSLWMGLKTSTLSANIWVVVWGLMSFGIDDLIRMNTLLSPLWPFFLIKFCCLWSVV